MDRTPDAPPPDLTGLVGRIRRMEEAGQAWSLSAEEVHRLLAVESAAFYRRIYAAELSRHPLVGLESATRRYTQESVGELVALLELFAGAQAETALERAGIFFPHAAQVEIMGTFVRAASRAALVHHLEEEEFSAMLRAFRRYERAREVYLEEHFPMAALLEEAARAYCAGRHFTIPALAERNVRGLLLLFFHKHVLDLRALLATVESALFAQAVREGYAAAWAGPGEESATAGIGAGAGPRRAAGPGANGAVERARRVMDLDDQPLTLARLKSRYKNLMKCYHPDVNPAGLRRCQEINAAYAMLLAGL